MQRLYSTFPDARPGLGLLVMRLSLAGAALKLGFASSWPVTMPAMPLPFVFSTVIAVALALGIGTPIAASILSLMLAYDAYFGAPDALCWVLFGVAASLVLIGPGAWSVDAVVFGRRKISIQRRPPKG